MLPILIGLMQNLIVWKLQMTMMKKAILKEILLQSLEKNSNEICEIKKLIFKNQNFLKY